MDFCQNFPLARVVFVKEGKGSTVRPATGRATDAMGVGTRGAGKVDIDYEIDGLEVNATMDTILCFFGGKKKKKGRKSKTSESPRVGGKEEGKGGCMCRERRSTVGARASVDPLLAPRPCLHKGRSYTEITTPSKEARPFPATLREWKQQVKQRRS